MKRTLSVLLKGNDVPDEIIVADQTADPDKRQQIEEACQLSRRIKLIHLEKPSLTAARNAAINIAQGEVLLFMDDDVDVAPDTIINLKTLMSDDKLAMAGGWHKDDMVPRKRSRHSAFFCAYRRSKRHMGHVSRGMYGNFPEIPGEKTPSEWAMGFFFAVKKEIIDKYHLRFDETLQRYAYAEDLDFTYHYFLAACKEGKECIFSTLLSVNHLASQEYRIPKKYHLYSEAVNRWYLSHKFFKNPYNRWAIIMTQLNWIIEGIWFHRPWKIRVSTTWFCIRHNRTIARGNLLTEKYSD